MKDPFATELELEIPDAEEEVRAEDAEPKLAYPNAGAWVNDWLSPRYRRELGGSKRRWDHQENYS
ncbi:DUF4913 domain-containing protein [Nesterenkonia sp. DZ6]|uniref:DUF4913 domain-containing protein n=1 Tax=Nesterenkonia sp. DZ6 TaxID=2901229 RepID=UPI001F4C57E5|nr:DUF4913 domain-containing protein [Nesterenkonia sp. DZ6]MCH8559580.1 DUF4913 domain-containing protein [Nesterenkonia sp. DZ6]